MKKFLILILLFASFPLAARAESLAGRLSGKILLDVEKNGEAWYVYPVDNKRYYLGRPADAFAIMRELGLGISEVDFQKIAQAGMPVAGDTALAAKLSGKIILEVEKNGEAWYVNPADLKKHYLGRPADAFRIMRELSLGISRENLAKIHKDGLEENINEYSDYEHKKVTVNGTTYSLDIVTIDLDNPNLKIVTDAAHPLPDMGENGSLTAKTLAAFVNGNGGFAGINGSYFECYNAAKMNYYYNPIYTVAGEMVNADKLKYWTTGPMIIFDENNNFYYFKDARDFKSVANFENQYGAKIQAAIGNRPRFIEDGMNLLIEWDIDDKQKNAETIRNAIGYKKEENGKGVILLVAAQNATLPDMADIMQALKIDYALNLDGGYSSALYYNDEYMVGPGRNIPNAIVFAEK